jgi:hypothetical protein
MPDEADRQEVPRVKRIMALRRFRDAVRDIESGTEQKDLPDTPMMRLALECMLILSGKGGH